MNKLARIIDDPRYYEDDGVRGMKTRGVNLQFFVGSPGFDASLLHRPPINDDPASEAALASLFGKTYVSGGFYIQRGDFDGAINALLAQMTKKGDEKPLGMFLGEGLVERASIWGVGANLESVLGFSFKGIMLPIRRNDKYYPVWVGIIGAGVNGSLSFGAHRSYLEGYMHNVAVSTPLASAMGSGGEIFRAQAFDARFGLNLGAYVDITALRLGEITVGRINLPVAAAMAFELGSSSISGHGIQEAQLSAPGIFMIAGSNAVQKALAGGGS